MTRPCIIQGCQITGAGVRPIQDIGKIRVKDMVYLLHACMRPMQDIGKYKANARYRQVKDTVYLLHACMLLLLLGLHQLLVLLHAVLLHADACSCCF